MSPTTYADTVEPAVPEQLAPVLADLQTLFDQVRAIEEAVERIEARVPFVSRFVPQDDYYTKLNNLIEAARAVEAMRIAPSYECRSAVDLDNLRDAVDALLAASWGRS